MPESSSQKSQKLAPSSQESEEAVLGSILINPEVLPKLAAFLQAEDFYFMHHRFIWEAMVAIFGRDEGIDTLTLVEDLRYRRDRDGQTYLDKIGGSAFITYLINNTPTHIHWETYGQMVWRLAERRRLLDYASQLARDALDDALELEEVQARAKAVFEQRLTRTLRIGLTPIQDLMPGYLKELEGLYSGDAQNVIVPTGFTDLDKLLGGGFMKSELVVIAGRPGMGKTAAMGSAAVNMAQIGKKVAMFELEMKGSQVLSRIMSSATDISTTKFRTADFDEAQWDALVDAVPGVERLPVWIDDTPARTVTQIEAAAGAMKRSFGLDVIFVDYLQIMGDSDIKADNRVGVVDKIIQSLKDMAKRLGVVVVVGCQLSRAVEQRGDKRPMLSDLRESGNIEAAADIVIGLYRDDFYNADSETPNQIEFIVLKSRSTSTGVVNLYFVKWTTTIKNIVQRTRVDLNTYTITTTTADGRSQTRSADPLLARQE